MILRGALLTTETFALWYLCFRGWRLRTIGQTRGSHLFRDLVELCEFREENPEHTLGKVAFLLPGQGRKTYIRDPSRDGPGTNSLTHTPYCILTSADIKLGYFESSVVPSSNQAKENIGGTQLGSVAWKSE